MARSTLMRNAYTPALLPDHALYEGTSGNDTLSDGDDGGLWDNDTLIGGDGDDVLYSYGGEDEIDGGTGFDILVWDRSGGGSLAGVYLDQDVVDLNGTLVTGIEAFHLILGGGFNLITASSGNDTIEVTGESIALVDGGDGADILIGASDGDTFSGDGGDDQIFGNGGKDYIYSGTGRDTVYGGADDDRVWGQGDLYGGDGDDQLVGGVISSRLDGGAGNDNLVSYAAADVIDGGAGADTLVGGRGADTFGIDNSGDMVFESSGGGADLVQASIDYTLGAFLENLTLVESADIHGTGNSLANILTGNSGNNRLDGGAGADTLAGGLGDDTYIVNAAADVIVEAAGQGTDTVLTTASLSLADHVENLTLSGMANLIGTGNALANVLTGNSGDNILKGGVGDDTYYVQNAGDNVREYSGEGTDIIYASVSYDLVGRHVETLSLTGTANIDAVGNSLANTLIGNGGNNTLNGAAGKDVLTGGLGSDIFLFQSGSGSDTVTDFSAGQNDTINVNAYTGGVANASLVTQVGSNVVIALGNGNVITVSNAAQADVLSHMVW